MLSLLQSDLSSILFLFLLSLPPGTFPVAYTRHRYTHFVLKEAKLILL